MIGLIIIKCFMKKLKEDILWGDFSYEYDPRNIRPYILIDFKLINKRKNSRFLIDDLNE
ncbi:hypothetical protein GCM10009117_25740 [Gangjinia marincola]|uniref:Uncharacterized protein n=1 Tax=Gangjinia marincola TaxID=578463 RepID=A0ABN1MJR9_9FLAO